MLPLFLVFFLGFCYSLTIAPSLTWTHFSADAGDLISAAATGGVAHPTGYPLYLIIARGFQLLPLGDIAFRTNLLSAVCTLITAFLLYKYLVHQLNDHSLAPLISFLAALAYGLAPFVWGQALVTEVYALHGLLMMLCVYTWSLEGPKIGEWVRGLVFGIAATNHLTAVIMFPLLALQAEGKIFASTSVFFRRSLGVACGLSLYLSLPIRASFDPPINWGNASTLGGFFWLVGGQLYRSYLFSLSWANIFQRLQSFAGLLLNQYTGFGALIGIYGLISSPSRRVLIPSIWMGIFFLLFAISYNSYDSLVYLLPVWLAFAVWLAYGLQDILSLFSNRYILQISICALLFVAALFRIPSLFSSVDVSKDFQARNFVGRTVQVIPRDSLVFVDGNEQIFSLWYAQYTLHQRLDMAIIAEGLLPYKWYQESIRHNYAYLNVPAVGTLQLSDLLAANPDRPICYIMHDQPIICVSDP